MGDSFGEFLRRLRKQQKKTQRGLADEVGVDFSYLSKLENDVPGFSSVSEPTLRRLAGALDADADELIARAGKVPEDVRRILIEDFSLIKEIRNRRSNDREGKHDD